MPLTKKKHEPRSYRFTLSFIHPILELEKELENIGNLVFSNKEHGGTRNRIYHIIDSGSTVYLEHLYMTQTQKYDVEIRVYGKLNSQLEKIIENSKNDRYE